MIKRRIKRYKIKRRLFYFKLILLLMLIIVMYFLASFVIRKDSSFFKGIPVIFSKPEEKPKPEVSKVSLIMTGDALIHGAIYQDAYRNNVYDFRPMLSLIKPIVTKYDLAFYNQETILGGTELGLSTYPTFNSPYEVGDAFIDAGFNIVSLANNHTLDRGEKAIINSRNYWNAKDVMVNGSANSMDERNNIQIKEKNNIKYAMIAYTTTTNGIIRRKDEFVNIYSNEQAKIDIESVRSKVDVLMVSMHWGEEYTKNETRGQRDIANYLSSLGVDVIIGTHPHVIEPIEYIGNTLVIYSLGNFISAQVGMDRLTGMMVSMQIEKTTFEGASTLSFSDPSVELIYTYSRTYNGKRMDFKVYPYSKIDDTILPGYRDYYNKYMSIATSKSERIQKVPLTGE